MRNFVEWLTENSLRKQLAGVPQNPSHHPEGDVYRHTTMVRSALEPAVQLLQQQKAADPSGPFANLDFQLSGAEYNILRLAGWLHDIGKSVTTDPVKLTAYGHEDPKNFEKAMQQLGPVWHQMYEKASQQDKNDLWFIIQHHMGLDSNTGFNSKALKLDLLDDDGRYKSDRRVKLLLVLLLMDRMGRGGSADMSIDAAREFVKTNSGVGQQRISAMYKSSDWMKDRASRIAATRNPPLPDEPSSVVAVLRQKGRPGPIIRQVLKGKFPNLPEEEINALVKESRMTFKQFYESAEVRVPAQIPLPAPVFDLSRIFKGNGYILYVVGGAVRDYLMHQQSGEGGQYAPKDVDLATDATPRDVERILSAAGVRNFEKGESFGVWVAHVKGEDYEIATFREDLGYSDGRRPDSVRWASPASDYKRRDLTMNALFYEIPTSPNEPGTIIDFGGGQGLQDIKDRKVRVVGDPYDRFGEDKLRIPRIVRFHSRYNDGDVRDVLDQRTRDAIVAFRDLRGHGVSGPRIQQEFLAGLKKAQNVQSYLRNYDALELLPAVFPGLQVDMEAVERLSGEVARNPIIVLALLLRKNGNPEKVRSVLNQLHWPNDVSDEVAFLLKAWKAAQNPNTESMVKQALEIMKKSHRRGLVGQFGSLVGGEVDPHHWAHLSNYEPAMFSGEEIQQRYGIKPGPEMGRKQRELQAAHYDQAFNQWRQQNGM